MIAEVSFSFPVCRKFLAFTSLYHIQFQFERCNIIRNQALQVLILVSLWVIFTFSIITTLISAILKDAELSTLTGKKVRQQIEEKLDIDLSSRRKEVDELVMECLQEKKDKSKKKNGSAKDASDDEEEEDEEEDDEEDEEEEEKPKRSAKKPAPKRKQASSDESEDASEEVSIKQMYLLNRLSFDYA